MWLNGEFVKDGSTYTCESLAIAEAKGIAEHFWLRDTSEAVVLVTRTTYERVKVWRENGRCGQWTWPVRISDVPAPILRSQRAIWSSRLGEIPSAATVRKVRFVYRFGIKGPQSRSADLTTFFRPVVEPMRPDCLACGLAFESLDVEGFRVVPERPDVKYPETVVVHASGVITLHLQADAFSAGRFKRCGVARCFGSCLKLSCFPTDPQDGPRWAERASEKTTISWTPLEDPQVPEDQTGNSDSPRND